MTSTTLLPPSLPTYLPQIVKISDEVIPRAHGRRGRRLSWRCLRVGPAVTDPVRLRA